LFEFLLPPNPISACERLILKYHVKGCLIMSNFNIEKNVILIVGLLVVAGCSNSSSEVEKSHEDRVDASQSSVDASVSSEVSATGETEVAADDVVAVSSSASPSAGRSSPESYMPIEATYITNGAVNQRATDMLKSTKFDKLLTAFDAQNAGGKNELASAYRVALEETLNEMAGGRKLDRISCATEMCIATIRTDDASWYVPWRDSLQQKLKLPMQVAVHQEMSLSGGMTEYRLLFTTGENSEGGIMGGPPQPGG
jgi:hypothetical protein